MKEHQNLTIVSMMSMKQPNNFPKLSLDLFVDVNFL